YVDASGLGLGIYFPWRQIGLYADLPCDMPPGAIFFFEAVAACSAIHEFGRRLRGPTLRRRLAIRSDNTNTCAIFTTLRALPTHNSILKSAVDVMLAHDIDVRLTHIPGVENSVADALSRRRFDIVQRLVPDLPVEVFTPPRDALGAA
ncbi:hypothetical protein B0H21DRAFT_666832, partial [Amylocystis lapponica]